MMRKLTATLAAAGFAAGIGLAGPADAATARPMVSAACPAKITHPNISLHTDPQYQAYSLVQSCGLSWAAWEIVAADGYDHGGVLWPGTMSTDYYADSFDVGGHLGKFRLEPDDSSLQAAGTFYIKLRSHAYVHGYRSGHWVYAWANVTRFNSNANFDSGGYTASSSRYVTFWDWYSGAWHKAGTRDTRSNGYTSRLKIWAPTKRSFKVVVAQTYTRWGAHSDTMYR